MVLYHLNSLKLIQTQMALDLERRKHKACQADLRKSITTVKILYKKLDKKYERNDVLAKRLQRLRKDFDSCQETINKLCHDLFKVRRHMRSQQLTSTQSRCTSQSSESVGCIKSEDTFLLWSQDCTFALFTGSTCTCRYLSLDPRIHVIYSLVLVVTIISHM